MTSVDILKMLQAKVGSADWSKWQIHRWHFYDYVRYPNAGTNQLIFFANALGSTDPNSLLQKSLEETNIPKTRSFGQVYFIIQEIRTHISILPKGRQHATIVALTTWIGNNALTLSRTLERLSHQGVLQVKIGQKDYFDIERPFQNAPPGFGPTIIQHASMAATAPNIWFKQSSFKRDVWAVSPPQMVEPEQTVEVTIDFPNANSPAIAQISGVDPRVDIGVIFDGYIARAAQ